MKFTHGKCLAKCLAYGTFSVYLAMDFTVDQTLILKLKNNCITQTFSFCSHHQLLLPLHRFYSQATL